MNACTKKFEKPMIKFSRVKRLNNQIVHYEVLTRQLFKNMMGDGKGKSGF